MDAATAGAPPSRGTTIPHRTSSRNTPATSLATSSLPGLPLNRCPTNMCPLTQADSLDGKYHASVIVLSCLSRWRGTLPFYTLIAFVYETSSGRAPYLPDSPCHQFRNASCPLGGYPRFIMLTLHPLPFWLTNVLYMFIRSCDRSWFFFFYKKTKSPPKSLSGQRLDADRISVCDLLQHCYVEPSGSGQG